MAETQQERGLVVYQSRDGQEIKLSFDTVRKYLVSGKPEYVTDQEIVLYMGTCKARGLNPFKKDCYLVKYTERDPAATIVAIDYYRSRARAQPDCRGWKSGIIVQSERGQDYREGSFMVEGEKLLGGWFKGKPAGWDDAYTWTVSLTTYIKKTREGETTQFWRELNQAYMINKVVEAQGLHRLWPDEFQALNLDDEFHALRDVTEPTPLKTPQAIREQQDEPKESARSTETKQTANSNDPPVSSQSVRRVGKGSKTENRDSGEGHQRNAEETASNSVEKQEATPTEQAEKTQEDWIAECLLWIENMTLEDAVNDDSWLMHSKTGAIKQVKGTKNQMQVLIPFNNRRQELAKEKT